MSRISSTISTRSIRSYGSIRFFLEIFLVRSVFVILVVLVVFVVVLVSESCMFICNFGGRLCRFLLLLDHGVSCDIGFAHCESTDEVWLQSKF